MKLEIENDSDAPSVSNTPKMNKTVMLENFTKLTKMKENIRIKAGTSLVRHSIKDSSETDKELMYTLGRLIRGTGASKVHAKYGFYSTLTALLSCQQINVNEIFAHISKELHKASGNSLSENADISTGQILVCGAIIRSGLFLNLYSADQIKVMELLINAGKERTYLTQASYFFITELCQNLNKKQFEKIVRPQIADELVKPLSEKNLDSFYLLLCLEEKFGKISNIEIGQSVEDIAKILMDIPTIAARNHPVYELFAKRLTDTQETNVVIDFIEQLDQMLRFNRNRLVITLHFITLTMKTMKDPNQISVLLADNVIKQIMHFFRQLNNKDKDNIFLETVQKFFDTLVEQMKVTSVTTSTKINILERLLLSPGTFIFEKITKSKIVQQIIATFNNEGVKQFALFYENVILLNNEKFNNATTEVFLNNDRLYAARMLVKLLNHPSAAGDNDWKCEKLKSLMHIGLLNHAKIGTELAGSLKETFYNALDLKVSSLNDLCYILSELFNDLNESVQKSDSSNVLRNPLSPDNKQIWNRTNEILREMSKKKKKKVKLVFYILFLHIGLQLFHSAKLATDSLQELFECYERIKEKHKQCESQSDEPEWVEVVTDLFLNLLSHNSHVVRSIINLVFPYLCSHLNSTAVEQILSVLDPRNEENCLTRKTAKLLSSDDESDGSDDDNVESEDNNEESEDSNEEDFDNDREGENDKLRMALHSVLIKNGNQSDQDSVDLDEMSENEGTRLDEALSEAFKQFKPNANGNSKKQHKDDEALTHFRIRVLDLIEIFVNSNPSMYLTLHIMLPLLHLLEFSIRDNHQTPLQNRVRSCLKKLTSLKKFDNLDNVDGNTLCELLTSLLDKGTKNSIMVQYMGEEIAQCCILIIKCSQCLLSSDIDKPTKKQVKKDVLQIVADSVNIFFKKRDSHIPYSLFKYIVQLNWESNTDVCCILNENAFNNEMRQFRKNQALELLQLFYSNNRLLTTEKSKIQKKILNNKTETLENILNLFQNAVDNRTNIKEKLFCNLLSLVVSIKNSNISISNYDWSQLGTVVCEYRSYVNITNIGKKAFNKFCSTLSISNVVKMKDATFKSSKNDIDDQSSSASLTLKSKKHKQKGLSKEKSKLKKESRDARLQGLSQGLELGFSSLYNITDVELDESESEKSDTAVKQNGKISKRKSSMSNDISVKRKK